MDHTKGWGLWRGVDKLQASSGILVHSPTHSHPYAPLCTTTSNSVLLTLAAVQSHPATGVPPLARSCGASRTMTVPGSHHGHGIQAPRGGHTNGKSKHETPPPHPPAPGSSITRHFRSYRRNSMPRPSTPPLTSPPPTQSQERKRDLTQERSGEEGWRVGVLGGGQFVIFVAALGERFRRGGRKGDHVASPFFFSPSLSIYLSSSGFWDSQPVEFSGETAIAWDQPHSGVLEGPVGNSQDAFTPAPCTSLSNCVEWHRSCDDRGQRRGARMGNIVRSVVAFIPSERCQRFLVGDLKEMPLDRTLDLSGCQLRRLPQAACTFDQLVKLYLSNNRLGGLPAELRSLRCLQLLALDFNCLEELPLAVCGLPQLNTLYLSNNRLEHLPPELALLTELRTLWLETNCFGEFPTVLCKLPALRTLHMGYNRLRSLPPELVVLGELHSIWLAGNLLADFPPVLLEMHQLDVIDVDRNRIRRFPGLTHLRGLKLVIYDHNPCVNAPAVAAGVRRVGRWADSSDDEEEEEEKERRRKQEKEEEDKKEEPDGEAE
ncbi:hypothetical protein JZ751_016094 [Albula glossodonta]|uniref:Disease resistance R13L4/SHOC-2-like LRR domain-containing protein n=1 Tax=Albula glossodonta TaxID=121402 RepID=A0A8T2P1W4_9TELE|nr:hypothetical protein JZ751_016094 [Albula glossodonta]